MCPSPLSDINICVQLIIWIKVCGTDEKNMNRYCRNTKFSIPVAKVANDHANQWKLNFTQGITKCSNMTVPVGRAGGAMQNAAQTGFEPSCAPSKPGCCQLQALRHREHRLPWRRVWVVCSLSLPGQWHSPLLNGLVSTKVTSGCRTLWNGWNEARNESGGWLDSVKLRPRLVNAAPRFISVRLGKGYRG